MDCGLVPQAMTTSWGLVHMPAVVCCGSHAEELDVSCWPARGAQLSACGWSAAVYLQGVLSWQLVVHHLVHHPRLPFCRRRLRVPCLSACSESL